MRPSNPAGARRRRDLLAVWGGKTAQVRAPKHVSLAPTQNARVRSRTHEARAHRLSHARARACPPHSAQSTAAWRATPGVSPKAERRRHSRRRPSGGGTVSAYAAGGRRAAWQARRRHSRRTTVRRCGGVANLSASRCARACTHARARTSLTRALGGGGGGEGGVMGLGALGDPI